MILAMTMTPAPSCPVISTLEPRGGEAFASFAERARGSGASSLPDSGWAAGPGIYSCSPSGEEGCRKG